jgi:RNA polymerase sigma-70 factor (ECF subfamily)
MNRAAAFFRKVLLMLGFYLSLIDEPDDKEKFAEIFRSYGNMMFSKAMSVLHNTALAEEAVQESFLKIAKNISKISEPNCSKTAAFIVIIVRNTALDMLKNEHINDTEPLDEAIPDISSDVLSRIISSDGYSALLNAVNGLDSIYSDVLMLKLVYGYDTASISKLMNIPVKTADSRIYRGKKLLMTKLEELYGTEKSGKQ